MQLIYRDNTIDIATTKPLIVAPLKNNFPLYSELIICPQLHTFMKVYNEPLNKL